MSLNLTDRQAWPLVLLACVPSGLAWAAMIGLGVARQGEAFAVAASATTVVFGPALLAGMVMHRPRLARSAVVAALWSMLLLLVMPVYFPGERRDAVATGVALLTRDPEGAGMARRLADVLPDEPDLAVAQVPEALEVVLEAPPVAAPLPDDAIELPYEGEGRRLAVPVVFQNGGREIETFMMLDTGATYTTLPPRLLAELGIAPGANAPTLTLNTANGEKTSAVVLLDQVWLGDLPITGVAITECADCESDEVSGLLGLNVTGGFNVTIDADRRAVVFAPRMRFNRRLDVRPFVDLEARFVRFPGGRVEVEADLSSRATRDLASSAAKVTCGEKSWTLELGALAAGEALSLRRRLPPHPRCEMYQIELDDASW